MPKYKVRVQTFAEGEKEFTIGYIWFYKGEIERVRCSDAEGRNYKFKHDEEPITLIEVKE